MIDKETAQKNFNAACAMYEDAKAIVKELSDYAKSVAPDFSFEVSMRQFDLMLQGILLRIAVEDGYYLEEERQFIQKITDYADIMSFYNNNGVSVSWDMFDGMTDSDRKDLSLKMLVSLDGLIDNFVTPFAIIDKALPKDYCKELTSNVGGICMALAFCDADSKESEAFKAEGTVAVALVEKMIVEKWENMMK